MAKKDVWNKIPGGRAATWRQSSGQSLGLGVVLASIATYIRNLFQSNARPLRMVVNVEQSQISFFRQLGLEVRIAVRFENNNSHPKSIRSFNATMIVGDTKVPLKLSSLTEVSKQPKTITMHEPLQINPGISSMYYVNFKVQAFEHNNQTFEVEMEALGQSPQRIEILPNWSRIHVGLVATKTVREIRSFN